MEQSPDTDVRPADQVGLGSKTAPVSTEPGLTGLMGKKLALVVSAVGFVVVGLVAYSVWPRTTSVPSSGTIAPLPTQPTTLADDSLGLTVSQLRDRWNEVDSPPSMSRGIPRTPEVGRFDGFSYRFNQSSVLAGVYDDRSEALYALLVSTWISDENAHRMVIHLCHVVHPYSPECLEAYTWDGLDGATLEDFRDLSHRAAWRIGDIRWRLEIEDNIQHIRVIAPGAN
jgi:hypothetical protein